MILTLAREGQSQRNYPFRSVHDKESILTDLDLFREGMITNAAEVLFGDHPARQFPQVRVRATVYATDKSGDFLDNRQFERCAFQSLEMVYQFIQRHTPISAKFPAGLRRKDQPAYPDAAVRISVSICSRSTGARAGSSEASSASEA
jgi:ATP-dependent DNA helicase RecG